MPRRKSTAASRPRSSAAYDGTRPVRSTSPAACASGSIGSAVAPFEIGDPPKPVGKSQPLAFHSQIEIAIRRTFRRRGSLGIFDCLDETILDLGHVRPLIGIDQEGISLGPDVLLAAERALNGLRSVGTKIEAVGIGLDAGGNAAPGARTLDEKQGHLGHMCCDRSSYPRTIS